MIKSALAILFVQVLIFWFWISVLEWKINNQKKVLKRVLKELESNKKTNDNSHT